MKKTALLTTLLLATVLCAVMLILPASAEVHSGSCGADGDNVQWSFDTETGLLAITGSGEMFDYTRVTGQIPWKPYRKQIKTVTIGEGVTNITPYAFMECSALTSATISNTVTSVDCESFSNCGLLYQKENNVYYVDTWAMFADANVTALTIRDGTVGIADSAFKSKQTLASVALPDTVKFIGENAFYYCFALKNVNISQSLTSIGSQAFMYCVTLENVTISNSVVTIGKDAFLSCTTSLQVENGVSYIDRWAVDCDPTVTSVTLRESTVGIADYTFSDCTALASIEIPNSVTRISNGAFANCAALASVTIPDFATAIGDGAFAGCTSLTNAYCHGTEADWNNSRITIGESNEQLLGALSFKGHTYGKWTHYDDAKHQQTCVCGDLQYADHKWNDGEITTEPKHIEFGVKTYTCTDCDDTKTEQVEKLTDHEWNDGEITTEPTHTEAGEKRLTCTCGETKTEEVAKTAEHEWNEGKVTTEPTVEAEGVKTFTCVCGETKTEAIAKLPNPETPSTENGNAQTPDGGNQTDGGSNGDASSETPKKSGCGSVIAISGTTLLLSLAGAFLIVKKKKD